VIFECVALRDRRRERKTPLAAVEGRLQYGAVGYSTTRDGGGWVFNVCFPCWECFSSVPQQRVARDVRLAGVVQKQRQGARDRLEATKNPHPGPISAHKRRLSEHHERLRHCREQDCKSQKTRGVITRLEEPSCYTRESVVDCLQDTWLRRILGRCAGLQMRLRRTSSYPRPAIHTAQTQQPSCRDGPLA
jgi:hypothetical protein